MRFRSAQSERSPRRGGFTLIELLIVLAVITILLSISWVVYGAAVENARASATRATLRQLDSVLQERVTAFQHVNLKSQAQRFKQAYDGASNTPAGTVGIVPSQVAEVVVRKDRFRGAFPQRLEDMFGIDGLPGTSDDSPLWSRWKRKMNAAGMLTNDTTIRPTGHRTDLENIELFYLAVTEGAIFGGVGLNLDRINSRHLRDTLVIDSNSDGAVDRGNGIPELIDEWGNPLRFYNWTTRLVRPAGEGNPIDLAMFRASTVVLMPGTPVPSASPLNFDVYSDRLNQDPDDPTGALSNAVINGGYFRSPSTFNLTTVGTCSPFDEASYGTLDTHSQPLIVSAGPDGKLGLNEPTSTGAGRLAQPLATSAGDSTIDLLYDNITNRQP